MLIETFDQFPLFGDLKPTQLNQLRPLFTICEGGAGTLLFEQGEPAKYLYLLVDGEVSIRYKPDDGPELHISRVRPGGVVGWSAILGNRAYTSGAVCTSQSQMLRVRGDELRGLCERHPETGVVILERLAAVIAERLRNTHEEVFKLLKLNVGSTTNSC
jgi:CRP-like cAMP-binding protein